MMTENSRVRSKDDEAPPGGAAHRPLRRAFVWGVAALTFVGTLEVATRVDDWLRWGAPLIGAYSHSALFGVDSIGWRPRPGAQFEKWQINQHGFRGPEVDRSPQPGTIRVAVLGASETFGQAESPGHEFPRMLERLLNEQELGGSEATGAFEVINAGVPGMSVARMREYWSTWVSGFEPDVVVLYPSPGFYLGNSAPADENPRMAVGASVQPDTPRLPARTRMVLNQFIPATVQAHLKRALIQRERSRHADDWVWSEVPPERLALFERHFRDLVTDLLDSGVKPILATHARAVGSLEGGVDATLVGWQKFHPRAEPHVILAFEERVNDLIVRVGREMGLPVVRLDAAVPPQGRYFSDHQHFTDAGARLAAEAIADVVLSQVISSSTGPRAGRR